MEHETPKIRRRLTDEERIARLDSQRQMIERRAVEKRRERVLEAANLIDEIEEIKDARNVLVEWLERNAGGGA